MLLFNFFVFQFIRFRNFTVALSRFFVTMETQRIKIASLFIASLISGCHTMNVMVHFLLFITIFLSSLEQAQMSYQQCRWNALFSWILEKCGSMSIAQLGWAKVVEYTIQIDWSFSPLVYWYVNMQTLGGALGYYFILPEIDAESWLHLWCEICKASECSPGIKVNER